MSDSVRPCRRQPTRLPWPWDSPGKNTGVGCHFLLQCMKVKSESEAAQSCLILSDSMDCSLPGSSSAHWIFQARVLEWVTIAFSLFLVKNPNYPAVTRVYSYCHSSMNIVKKTPSCGLLKDILAEFETSTRMIWIKHKHMAKHFDHGCVYIFEHI